MGKCFEDSIKALEADIQLANTLASDLPKSCENGCLEMRLSYSPFASFFLFLVKWTNCSLAGALGLLRILINQVKEDDTTTIDKHEKKSSIRQFYRLILPSLMQLQRGITDVEEQKQREMFEKTYKKRTEEISEVDWECGVCIQSECQIVLPNCYHALCMKCYTKWRAKSSTCPFCRDNLSKTKSEELWVLTNKSDVEDLDAILSKNSRMLLRYIKRLPSVTTTSN